MLWLLAFLWLQALRTEAGDDDAEFPSPQKDFVLCGRRNASFVCDPDNVLAAGDVDRLDYLAFELQATTTCLCSSCDTGISVGIFIKRNLLNQTVKIYKNAESLAEMLRRKWQLGKCGDDIVIVLISDLNITGYSLGPAIQDIFPKKTAQLILKDCSVHFQSGWYYQGLESVLQSFSDVLVRHQRKTSDKAGRDMSLITGLSMGIGVLLILLIISIVVLRRRNERRRRGCSDIYNSVPKKNKYLSEKIGEFQEDKMQKQFSINSDDYEDDDLISDDEKIIMPSQRLIKLKRQLSAVEEDPNEEVEEKKADRVPLNALTNAQQENFKQMTEL